MAYLTCGVAVIPILTTSHRPGISSHYGRLFSHSDFGCGLARRLEQWLKQRQYASVQPTLPLQLIDDSDTTKDYVKSIHYGDSRLRTTDETHKLLALEALVYKAAVDGEYPELRNHSGRNLRYEYPVYPRELATTLRDWLIRYQSDLVGAREATLPTLRMVVDPIKQFQALLGCAKAPDIQNGLRELRKNIKSEVEAKMLVGTLSVSMLPEEQHGIGHQVAHSTEHERKERGSAGDASSEGAAGDNYTPDSITVAALNAINAERVVVALKSGYGTLRKRGSSIIPEIRNEDFNFQRGDILILQPHREAAVSGRHSVTVVNLNGEVGEVYWELGFVDVREASRKGRVTDHYQAQSRYTPPPSVPRTRLGATSTEPRGSLKRTSDRMEAEEESRNKRRWS